jgi:hypothetical protein
MLSNCTQHAGDLHLDAQISAVKNTVYACRCHTLDKPCSVQLVHCHVLTLRDNPRYRTPAQGTPQGGPSLPNMRGGTDTAAADLALDVAALALADDEDVRPHVLMCGVRMPWSLGGHAYCLLASCSLR